MSAPQPDARLAALLATYRPPSPPDDLAARIAAHATTLPQEPPLGALRRAWRSRRGTWMRRPIVAGAAAFGLAVSSAVAATYAGIPLPRPVEQIIAELPFVPAAPPRKPVAAKRPERQAAATPSPPAPPAEEATAAPAPGSIDARMQRAREIVAARRAAGLSTPRADRIERAMKTVEARRAAGLPTPTADRIEQAIERRRAREQQGVAPAQLDAEQREALRAEIGRRLLARRELLRRAQAGDPDAIVRLEELRRRQQERRARWRAERDGLNAPQAPSDATTEGFSGEPR